MANKVLGRGVVVLALVGLAGCSRHEAPAVSTQPAALPASQPGGGAKTAPNAVGRGATVERAALPATSRKIIRDAELSMVVTSPSDAEASIGQLVERLGGYVASSEHQAVSDSETRATLALRVPVLHMQEALGEIRRLAVGPSDEKIGSEDVTDEYIDLAAHISNQLALEKQLSTILAQASSVDAALRVHHELADVRTEIDRLQGRQRFLESESALAKIAVSLAPQPKPPQAMAVAPTTFGGRLRGAAVEAVEVATALTSGIVIFGIQAAGVLLPLAVLFGLPALAGVWLLRRRYKRLAESV